MGCSMSSPSSVIIPTRQELSLMAQSQPNYRQMQRINYVQKVESSSKINQKDKIMQSSPQKTYQILQDPKIHEPQKIEQKSFSEVSSYKLKSLNKNLYLEDHQQAEKNKNFRILSTRKNIKSPDKKIKILKKGSYIENQKKINEEGQMIVSNTPKVTTRHKKFDIEQKPLYSHRQVAINYTNNITNSAKNMIKLKSSNKFQF